MKQLVLSLLFVYATLASIAQDKQPVQCKGTTVKGVQCQRNATEGTTYCKQHNPETPHCAGKTSKGLPCKAQVKKQGDKCHNHYFQQQ